MSRLRLLWQTPPSEIARQLRRKLARVERWTVAELLAPHSKHRDGGRFISLLMRQEAALASAGGWTPLDFHDARVIELGCGPLGGFGPLALFLGAARFESADPEFDPAHLRDPRIITGYLRPLHIQLCGTYGPRMTLETFLARIAERMVVHAALFQDARFTPGATIVLSQSCLEHVFPLDTVIAALARVQAADARFLHAVDFGNHRPTAWPFDGLYTMPREAWLARHGRAINLLRPGEMLAIFEAAGLRARLVPIWREPPPLRGPIDPWWRAHHDETALLVRHALIASA